jgi:hypothetical protein
MHDLEPRFFTWGSLPIYSFMLRMTAEAFFVFPFGIPEGCRYTRVAAPLLALSLLTCWVSSKSLIQALRKCWRIESPVQVGADGGRNFDVKDISWASELCRTSGVCSSRQSLAVCLFPRIGFSDAEINALQDHRPSSFVHPLPVPLLAQGGRLAGRSSVSPQVAAARK